MTSMGKKPKDDAKPKKGGDKGKPRPRSGPKHEPRPKPIPGSDKPTTGY